MILSEPASLNLRTSPILLTGAERLDGGRWTDPQEWCLWLTLQFLSATQKGRVTLEVNGSLAIQMGPVQVRGAKRSLQGQQS